MNYGTLVFKTRDEEVTETTNLVQRDSYNSSGRSIGTHNESFYSRTDTFEKTGTTLTMVNIIKSFIGLGILAGPSGYQVAGFIPATFLIVTNAALSMLTVQFQTKTKEAYGGRVKTYSDLGEACFGQKGRVTVSVTIALNQILCGIGYVMFFMEQLN